MDDAPLILGFDTAGPYCAAALLAGGRVLAQTHVEMATGQAEALMPLVEELLATAGVGARDLGALGVGIGPGNFTGIRIAVAAGRGLALALGIPAVGVSRLEALAEGAAGPVLAVLDARRGMVYAQAFGPAPRGPALIAAGDLGGWMPPGGTCIAPDLPPPPGMALAAPVHPVAVATARIAEARHRRRDLPRPAPLYLRDAGAAPARATGAVLLP